MKEASMKEVSMNATIIPSIRYRDCPAAIDFLCKAFGFEKHLIVPGPDNTIAHAQLRFGGGMMMCGSASNEGAYGALVKPPASFDAPRTHGLYVIVSDVDGHCARARAEGALVLMEPADQDYGGRLYTCRDKEGYVWSFGSYDPWAG
jgi:uncharacterized glyoxalase superfamily protein PhnB